LAATLAASPQPTAGARHDARADCSGIRITRITPAVRGSSAEHAIDEFAPRFHFQEQHDIIIAAPPDRVFAAIKSVSADQIALFNVLTAIRRLGRPGPESILNAPNQQPILDVAVRTGFLLLSEQPPHEVVLGTWSSRHRELPNPARSPAILSRRWSSQALRKRR
jgi:hypothetical protein